MFKLTALSLLGITLQCHVSLANASDSLDPFSNAFLKNHELERSNSLQQRKIVGSDVIRNREIILSKTLLKRYAKFADCMVEASEYFEVPEWLIYAIVYHERGPIGGSLVNPNTTKDHGPSGINDVRLLDYRNMGVRLTAEDIRKDPCVGIRMTGHLLRIEYDELKPSEKDWMTAVGNYHYDKRGDYPRHHYKYKRHILDALQVFKRTIESNQ